MTQPRTGYASGTAKSTELVSLLKWRLVLAALLVTLIGGAALAATLSSGLADPPRATNLIIDHATTAGLVTDGQLQQPLVASLRSYEFPITIEVAAETSNRGQSAWGLWLRSLTGLHIFRLRADGYWSLLLNGGWQQFIHIRPGENMLYLHIDPQGNATFRINDEIAWTGNILPDLLEWGVIHDNIAPIHWRSIRLYSSG